MKQFVKAGKIFFLLIVWGVFFLSCNSANPGNDNPPAKSKELNPQTLGSPEDFFPSETGTRWVYEIKLAGKKRPLERKISRWPLGNSNSVRVTLRSGLLYGKPGKDGLYRLVLRVKGPAKEQGPRKYKHAVELEIERDDLGIYADNKGLFWLFMPMSEFRVIELTLLDPNSPGNLSGGTWGHWNQAPGYSEKFKIFGAKPGIGLEFSKEDDVLIFLGPEIIDKKTCLHYRRDVKQKKNDVSGGNYLSSAFTEDLWFEKYKGLIRLEQRVGDEITMTWTLLTPPEGSKGKKQVL